MRLSTREVPLVERLLIFRTIDGFSEFADGELAILANAAHERMFGGGDLILAAGQPVAAFFAVVEGRVQILLGGRPAAMEDMHFGLGGLDILAYIPGALQVVAEVPTLALELPVGDFIHILQETFPILERLVRRVSVDLAAEFSSLTSDRGPSRISLPQGLSEPDARDYGLVERMMFIRNCGIFAESSLDAVAQLAKLVGQVRFATGETIWEQGSPADEVLWPIAGVARCQRVTPTHGAGEPEPAAAACRYGPTDMLGGVDVLGGRPRWGRAVAETEVVALRAHREVLLDVMQDNFALARSVLAVLARTLLEVRARQQEGML